MAKKYDGSVDLYQSTTGKLAIRANPAGKYSNDTADALYARVLEVVKERKIKAENVKIFAPEGTDLAKVAPMILQGRYGPYLALLPKEAKTTAKKRVEIL